MAAGTDGPGRRGRPANGRNRWALLLAPVGGGVAIANFLWGRPFAGGLVVMIVALNAYQWKKVKSRGGPPTAADRATEMVRVVRLVRVVAVASIAYAAFFLSRDPGARNDDTTLALLVGTISAVFSGAFPLWERRRRPRSSTGD